MSSLEERVKAEHQNIEKTLSALPNSSDLREANHLEVAGVAALLHNFYNGVENILKQIVTEDGDGIYLAGESWHRELLQAAVEMQILSQETESELRAYLAFRHFFVHSYALTLDEERLRPLVDNANKVYQRFLEEALQSVQS